MSEVLSECSLEVRDLLLFSDQLSFLFHKGIFYFLFYISVLFFVLCNFIFNALIEKLIYFIILIYSKANY